MRGKLRFEPRRLMEQAVAVMRQSVNEPRVDGKASPLVGAVLVKRDGTVDTAFRGEFRHGDHAEYTLLELCHEIRGAETMSATILFPPFRFSRQFSRQSVASADA